MSYLLKLLVFFTLIRCAIYGDAINNTNRIYYVSLAQQFKADLGVNITNDETAAKLYRLVQQYHEYKLQWFYQKRRFWSTSNVGTLLFKNAYYEHYRQKNTTFIIFILKQWFQWFKSRHLSNQPNRDPLGECSVKNCLVTDDIRKMQTADAVVVDVQHGQLPPAAAIRRPFQRWVFLSDESPFNIFSGTMNKPKLSKWANIFNWTMTYRNFHLHRANGTDFHHVTEISITTEWYKYANRFGKPRGACSHHDPPIWKARSYPLLPTDSDVPIPYGRTLPITNIVASKLPESILEYIPYWKNKRRDVLITVLMSSCWVPARMNYIEELQRYINVDVYGKCSHNNKDSCPGRYIRDCPVLNNYLFYLAFENSHCRQYITEKTFYNSYVKGAIPIIMGPPKEDCHKLLPVHSFLHVDDFASPKELSIYIRKINMNDDILLKFHQWRRFFKIVNEHGYSGTRSSAVCRLCEALNFNDERPKVYTEDDLKLFFDFNILCNSTARHLKMRKH